MRVLLFPMGSAGDVHPFIGLGMALQSRGHEVFVITSGYFADHVRAAGLDFRELGSAEDFRLATADPDLWNPRRAFRTIIEKGINFTYEPAMRISEELHKPGATVMAAGTLAVAARNVRDKLGIPLATVHLAPGVFLSSHRMPRLHGAPVPQWAPRWLRAWQWRMAGRVTDRIVLPALNAYRRELGLPPARDVVPTWWHSPDRVIGLFPDWFGPPQPDWPQQTRLTGFPLYDRKEARPMPPALEQWLADGDAPVVFTPGTAMEHGSAFFREAVKAMQMLGRRALLLSQFADTVPGDLPSSVRHEQWAPMSEILKRASLLVYHGGVGTCAQALKAGVPHLVMHMAHDQLDNLSRVHDLGVGDGGPPRRFKARWIAQQVERLTGDEAVRANCREVASRFDAEQWMRESCELIEQLGK